MSKNANDELISMAAEGMAVFRAEMETIDRISKQIGGKTTRIIRVVMGLLSVVSIYLVVLTFNMSRDLSAMITSLDEMYAEFGYMSKAMNQITANVTSMGRNVQGMPAIAQNMVSMNADVGGMLLSVATVNASMGNIDANVYHISQGTSEMSYRFNNVQQSVNVMQYDVNQLIRPLDMMPR